VEISEDNILCINIFMGNGGGMEEWCIFAKIVSNLKNIKSRNDKFWTIH